MNKSNILIRKAKNKRLIQRVTGGGKVDYDKNELKSQKILKYINEFWICFNEEEKDEMFKILICALNRTDNKVDEMIKKYK